MSTVLQASFAWKRVSSRTDSCLHAFHDVTPVRLSLHLCAEGFPFTSDRQSGLSSWRSHGEHHLEGSQDQEYTSAGYACIGYGYTGDMDAARVWINGKFSVFHTDDTGSIPVTRCLLGEIGIHDRLKICSQLWGIGSSPIVSRYLIPHSTVDVILPFYVLPA